MVSKTYSPCEIPEVGEQISKCQKGICHPELVSGSHKEIPNRVRNDKKVKAAFTLAEVLITLGIIGVVAAMTIPTLISNYKERVTITKVKQTFSYLTQAYTYSVLENGTPETWKLGTGMYDSNAHVAMANYFKPYFKLSKDCVGKSKDYVMENCLAIASDGITGEAMATSMRLNNGVTIKFRMWSPDCAAGYANDNNEFTTCGAITAYIDPMSSNQKSGRNIFEFYLTKKGVVPMGMDGSGLTFEKACNLNISNPYPSFTNGNMYACTAWVVYNSNMDYLKCPGDLSWDGKHKCSD